METLLINFLIVVIVFAIVIGVIKAIDSVGWFPPPSGRIAMLVAGGIFLICIILYILVPLLHMVGHL